MKTLRLAILPPLLAALGGGASGYYYGGTSYRIRKTTFKAALIEIFHKRGHVVMRCGFAWYGPSTRICIASGKRVQSVRPMKQEPTEASQAVA